MGIKYLAKDGMTCERLEHLLGVRVLSITMGNIAVGGPEEASDEYGKSTATIPTAEGIEIEFEDEPAFEQLDKLDLVLTGYRRERSKTMAERLEEIESKIKALEDKEQ